VVRERLADLETPVSAFAKLRPLGGAFLLESVEGGERMGRYSFIGVLPRATFVFRDGVASILDDGGVRSVEYTDPLATLRREVGRFRQRTGAAELPRFSGGAVGYVGYEAARRFERLPAAPRDVHRLPEAAFSIYDTVVCFDHVRHSLLVIAHEIEGEREGAESRIARVFAALDAPLSLPRQADRVVRAVTANGTADEYRARVTKARELIAEGDCIQIVLAQRFDVRPAPEPLALYRALRHVNPSPYMFLIDIAGAALVGASPEPFVRVEDGRVVMHPIAGTRRRGRDENEDAAMEAELRASEKERAEHVMLVDLARNDIGRVSKPGTVRVRELMRVDRFSHVMHLTSVVDGELAPGLDALDAFRACFPAGTVSGAPKIRAMERIAELETDRRGPYAGAVGYLGFDGRMDTCIGIRTAVIADGVCRIQAGAGIVADSDPAAEELETRAKARALLRAIEIVDGAEAVR
jgi:anthranilate synthase component 1